MGTKTAVITGAGSGLGRACALQFSKQGWNVVAADINEAGLSETSRLLKELGYLAHGVKCDVTKRSDLENLKQEALMVFGAYHVVINGAGVAGAGRLLDTDMQDIDWVLNINLRAVIEACQVLLQPMISAKEGHVINVASFAYISQSPYMTAYNVSKSGVYSLSETIRGELEDDNVRVSVICPSFFKTNLMDSFRSPDERHRPWVKDIMETSSLSAEMVAHDIYRAVQSGKFLILSTRLDRMLYRFKRLFPEAFGRLIRKKMSEENLPK